MPAHIPDGSITRWWGRPVRVGAPRVPEPGIAGVVEVLVAVCLVVLRVAAVAAPEPSSVTVTGSVRPKVSQERLSKDMPSLFAMNVNRLSPTDGTGDEPVVSSAWLAARNGAWMSTMFWQNIAGLLVLLFCALTGAWPISSRYRLVLAASNWPLLFSTISSFSGTSAATVGWCADDSSSSIAWELVSALLFARSGAWKGVQPSSGSINASSRVLSLPLASSVESGIFAVLDAVSCAVWPVAGSSR